MTTRSALRRLIRWSLGVVLVLVALLVLAGAAFFAFAGRYDLGPIAAARLSAKLERKVTVGGLHVTPGRWLHVELRDLQVANLPTGSKPMMAAVTSAEADIDVISILHGPVTVRGLMVKGLDVLLEHTSDGKKNWRFGGERQGSRPRSNGRGTFPTLLGAELTGSVLFRTSSGTPLDTRITHFRLDTEAADKPVRLTGNGAYNDTPIKLEADLASLDALRDSTTPYPADVTIVSGDSTLHFVGTTMDPLNADGVNGKLELMAPTSAAIAKVAGTSNPIEASLRLGGLFEHNDPVWHLSQASGVLNQDKITAADLNLTEGRSGEPDNIVVDLAFEQLDVNALLGKKAPGAETEVPLTVDRAPDTLIEARLATQKLAYAGFRATDVTFSGSVKPGKITVDALSLGYLGTPFKASGQIEALPGSGDKAGGHVTANVDMNGMDVQALRQMLDAGNLPIFGRADGKVIVDANGATLNQATRSARMSAVLAMTGGSIARQIVEMASTDPRALFRKASEMTPITCFIGVVDIRGGAGTLSPLRIRSVGGTITGRGTFDLLRHQLDLTVASESKTTGIFALDVPMRVTGSFSSPAIRPAVLSATGRAQLSAGDDISRLLPELRPFARRNPCLSGRGG